MESKSAAAGNTAPASLPGQETAKMVREPVPALSIVNAHPSLLPGPRLLHELVPFPSNAAARAIDFLENGARRELSYEDLHALSDEIGRAHV